MHARHKTGDVKVEVDHAASSLAERSAAGPAVDTESRCSLLRILGSSKTLCDGITRRDMIRVGSLGAAGLGLGLDQLLARHAAASQAPNPDLAKYFGRAKSCILLFLYGSPSQLETFDTKPDAPAEIKGELGVIPSSLPGLNVCELLPNTAKVMDRTTVVRSLTHPYPVHGVAYATTGIPTITVPAELNPHDALHWPFFGSVVDYVEDKASGGSIPTIPRNLALPWPFSTRRRGEVHRAGPYAAFLGPAFNPTWTDFQGKGSRLWEVSLAGETLHTHDPYSGIAPECKFPLSTSGDLPEELTLDRLNNRLSLLDQFDSARRSLDKTGKVENFDRCKQMAYSVLTNDKLRDALDIGREPASVRDSYGMTLFGQSALVARRLVEAGGRLATVFWDEFGLAGSGWDTHWQHYPRMKDQLLPGFDRAFSGLIRDLDARGMLDETLVLVLSEHGRTPKITTGQNGGRDHWSRAYSLVFAGGGMARGRVVGRTDRIAGDVIDLPISPKDILATAYFLLGIDPQTIVYDRLGRPLPIAGEGIVRPELLG